MFQRFVLLLFMIMSIEQDVDRMLVGSVLEGSVPDSYEDGVKFVKLAGVEIEKLLETSGTSTRAL